MHRVFVEKFPPHDIEARHLLADLKESLTLPGLESLRIIQRYEVEGITKDKFDEATRLILSEPQVDRISPTLEHGAEEQAFAIEYLPGQFDQRADSAAQCIQILTGGTRPNISSSKVIVLRGNISKTEIDAIRSFAINPVDSHEVPLTDSNDRKPPVTPKDVAILSGFNKSDPEQLRNDLGLAMSAADVAFTQAHFRDEEKRDPSITEIRVLDTYWSDHCRHTTFLTEITDVVFDDENSPVYRAWNAYLDARKKLGRDNKPISLMDIALMGMRELRASGELDNLEESDEVNAASIVVPVTIKQSATSEPTTEEWLVMFKNETHNHPTEIEPFGGAATCLGGCIRDPLSGRSYVYQAMRVTGAGNPLVPFSETLPGKLPQRKICRTAAHGYSSYGNQIGLATGEVAEVYHPGYVAKRLEIGAVVAAAPRSQVFRGKPASGDAILLIGGRTGRDGVGGATGSSKEHTDTALENSAEVQKGDAPTERKIQRLFRNPVLTRKIKVCNDFGAGGVSVAIGEIAPSLLINLDAVPKKYDGLDGTELAISESQERMAVCIDPSDISYFLEEADRENLECKHVADVTDDGRLVMTWRGQKIVDLSREFLDTNGASQSAAIHVSAAQNPFTEPKPESSKSLVEILSDLSTCSRKGLGAMFDASVGAGTVLWPFGGKNQITAPDAMVAKLPLLDGDTDACTFMAWGFDPFISEKSPFHGAIHAVTESVCKIVAAGGRLKDIRLTFQEYFPKLGNDPKRWGKPFAALLGAYHAQQSLRLAAIGGKDSMSGSFNDLDVPPTLVSFALAPGHASLALSPEFKISGSEISLIQIPFDNDGLPDFEILKSIAETIHSLNKNGHILSLHHVGQHGIAAALAKMTFGNDIGAKVDASCDMFAAASFSFIVEHATSSSSAIKAAIPALTTLGHTTEIQILAINGASYPLATLKDAWQGTLEPVYPTGPSEVLGNATADLPDFKSSAIPRKNSKSTIPKVIIPAFPGTNSEYDSAKSFREAGGDAQILVFRNLGAQHISESIDALAAKIRESQILMFPGGFSAGDEPDGSAKFIATIIRNPKVADAIMDLIHNRDGLILGICNGFQALIKTGLVPYGEIRTPSPESPTLVHNTIGRHISQYVHTRVTSNQSPWLALNAPGDIHTVPVSHGEGRFYADTDVIKQLAASGQIATQYCDANGKPSLDNTFNPNGSAFAIEGITSPCGRIFGKMAHSERAGTQVAKNIPGNKHQPIFEAGIRYFQ
ncbi:MAG: phosphoribosylformylglycinamidine synthase [Akkermansiaceae bacterium]|nr:phosphoribosylformylglycinamidine synthase [Akkermansiaceae bacterium]